MPVGQAAEPATQWRALGVLVRLVVTDPEALAPARDLLHADVEALDLACSRFRADSEVRRLEEHAGRATDISPLLTEALAAALDAARCTDGDVDPTVGNAMCELGYDRDLAALPADGPRLSIRPTPAPGWQRVQLDRAAGRVTVPHGVRLDLGATAKAWAADRAAERIHRELGTGVLVALGGDLAVQGGPEGGWQVLVQDRTDASPSDDEHGPTQLVSLHAGGLATSSTLARRWSRGGDVLHHVLDPRTGLPARTPWRTVSVVAQTALAANAASTAAVVRGTAAPDWLARHGWAARLVDHTGQVTLVGGWPR